MGKANSGQGCCVKCWSVAGAIGFVTAIILMTAAGKSVIAGLILGALAAGLLGLLFNWLFCAPVPAIGASRFATDVEPASAAPVPAAAKPAAPAPVAPSAAAETPLATTPETPEPEAAAEAPVEDLAEAEGTPAVKPSASLAGQAELSEKKGDWRYEGGDTPDIAPVAEASEPLIKPSTALAGQAELAAKKGSWRYEGGDTPAVSADLVADALDTGEDYDRDGVVEGTDEGTRPALLDAPGAGGADNLKEIKGIGPKLEKVCNDLGVYHFSQIAAWSEDEVAWANANLVGFKGRVSRDNWVEQAKILAAGGETEFSKRVDKGGVY